jgi:hypothetical protein
MGKHLGFHLGEQEGVEMVLKSNKGGEEVVDLLLRSKTSSTDKKTKEEERFAGSRQQRESRRLDAADPHQGNGEEAEGGNTTDAPAADDLTSDGNSTTVGCGRRRRIERERMRVLIARGWRARSARKFSSSRASPPEPPRAARFARASAVGARPGRNEP